MDFEFQVISTRSCNLGCRYCYMKNIKNSNMTKEIFLKHYNHNLEKLLKYYNCDKYNIILFGGEPTLNLDLLSYVGLLLKKDDLCNHKVLVTNGLILNDKNIDIIQYKLGYNISFSFDGLWNESNRVFVNNTSSLDYYLSKKEFYKKFKSSKVMISPNGINKKSLLENYLFFKNNFNWLSPMFALVRDDIWKDKDIKLFEEQSLELVNYLKIENNKENNYNVGLPDIYVLPIKDIYIAHTMKYKRPYSCFSGCNGAGFMPDGTVYPCARFSNEDKFQLIDSNGNLNHKNLELMKYYSDVTKFDKCKKCDIYKYCNTGCHYSQIENNDQPVDNLCQLYKILHNHVNILLDNITNTYFEQYIRKMITI